MPRVGLTRAKIAVAALELIDEIGIDEFSMRKLGARLNVGPMAIYRHFRDREDLFDAVAEHLFEQIDLEVLPWEGTWSVLARQYCLRLLGILLAHPRAVTTFATRPVRSPASIASGVRMLRAFCSDGFSPADGLRVARSLRELTIGHALSLATVRLGSEVRSRKPKPDDPSYNLLAEAADATKIDDHFDVALAAILDGFGKLRQPDQPASPQPPEQRPEE